MSNNKKELKVIKPLNSKMSYAIFSKGYVKQYLKLKKGTEGTHMGYTISIKHKQIFQQHKQK